MLNIKLPDYDDMIEMTIKIRDSVLRKDALDLEIKARESEIYKVTNHDSSYWIGGKPPSASYVKATYEFPGLSGELIEKRKQLSEEMAFLEMLRLQFDIMKMQVELYRTESANRRNATL